MKKEDLKKIANKYYDTEEGKEFKGRCQRIIIISIIGYLYSIYLLFDLVFNKYTIWNLLMLIILVIACTYFLICIFYLKKRRLIAFKKKH